MFYPVFRIGVYVLPCFQNRYMFYPISTAGLHSNPGLTLGSKHRAFSTAGKFVHPVVIPGQKSDACSCTRVQTYPGVVPGCTRQPALPFVGAFHKNRGKIHPAVITGWVMMLGAVVPAVAGGLPAHSVSRSGTVEIYSVAQGAAAAQLFERLPAVAMLHRAAVRTHTSGCRWQRRTGPVSAGRWRWRWLQLAVGSPPAQRPLPLCRRRPAKR